ncbi:MAG: hypothetical protein WDZ48_07985 [Pirellulales bacterium]
MLRVVDVDAERTLSGESANDAIIVVQGRAVGASGARRTITAVAFARGVLVASAVAVVLGGVVVQQTTEGVGGQEGRQHHERSQTISRRATHRHNPGNEEHQPDDTLPALRCLSQIHA